MGQTILLADDSITIQKVIELTFADEDFQLHTVGNGQKAIEEIRSVKPDIVLCDIIMPEKNGYEVCEFIKGNDDLKHIPVLLLTGAFEPFDQERARKAGCDGFLAKPFEPQTLISKVRELLAAVKSAAASAGTAASAAPAPGIPEAPKPATPPVPPAPPAESSDATVMMGSPIPPQDEPSREETAFSEGFIEEAGERELSVEPGDQTVLLGDETSASNDDIWSEMQHEASAPSTPKSSDAGARNEEDEGATVMMGSPPPAVEPTPVEESPSGGGLDQFASVEPEETSASDDAWVIDTSEDLDEEPELTPLGDFGGFEELSAPEASFDEPASTEERSPAATPPPPPSEPPPAAKPVASSPPSAPSEPRSEPVARPEPTPPPPPRPVSPEPPPAAAPRSAPPQPVENRAAGGSEAVDMDELVERVTERVVARLSEKIIQEVAWEVVPDLAQTLIQREIDALKAKIPK